MIKAVLFTAITGLVLLLGACSAKTNGPAETASVAQTQSTAGAEVPETEGARTETEGNTEAMGYDFKQFSNVNITGIDISSLNEEELAILYAQARYCQAMTDADIDTMRELVSEDMVFTHMSGMQQTREEYFADVADGSLNYFTIGIADPVITVEGEKAQITYTSVLNANAYGARGTFRMKGTHHYEKRDGAWIAVNR